MEYSIICTGCSAVYFAIKQKYQCSNECSSLAFAPYYILIHSLHTQALRDRNLAIELSFHFHVQSATKFFQLVKEIREARITTRLSSLSPAHIPYSTTGLFRGKYFGISRFSPRLDFLAGLDLSFLRIITEYLAQLRKARVNVRSTLFIYIYIYTFDYIKTVLTSKQCQSACIHMNRCTFHARTETGK